MTHTQGDTMIASSSLRAARIAYFCGEGPDAVTLSWALEQVGYVAPVSLAVALVPPSNRRIAPERRAEIRRALTAGETQGSIVRRVKVSKNTVGRIALLMRLAAVAK